MGLDELYRAEGKPGLVRLAGQARCSWKYLWQIACTDRAPSVTFAKRLVAADARLGMEAVLKIGTPPLYRAGDVPSTTTAAQEL